MDLRDIRLSEICQTQKDMYCLIPSPGGIFHKIKDRKLQLPGLGKWEMGLFISRCKVSVKQDE